jgi:inner membrane transporter RhtA
VPGRRIATGRADADAERPGWAYVAQCDLVPDQSRRSQLERIPAVWLVLAGIVSVQLGAAIAKNLFGEVSPTAMVWMRLATSAIVLMVIARPSFRGRSRADWLTALGFGVALVVMNWAIYQSFARIPLGMAVTIEFLGPLTLAVLGSRRPRDLLWVLLAGGGVALLGFSPAGLTVPGVLFALLAGAAWAGYILLSARTGRRWPGVTGLAIASLVGAVVLAPPALVGSGGSLLDPRLLALGVAVGLLSSVIPYSLELTALRRLTPQVFGILMSLEPAAAALAAIVLLGEFLAPLQWVALVCVVVASVGATRSSKTPPSEPVAN